MNNFDQKKVEFIRNKSCTNQIVLQSGSQYCASTSSTSRRHLIMLTEESCGHYSSTGEFHPPPTTSYNALIQIIHEEKFAEAFEMQTGVRQGCLLSPLIFLMVVDWIIQETTRDGKTGSPVDLQV